MKKKNRIAILLVLIMMFSIWGAGGVSAAAESKKPVCPKNQTIRVIKNVSDEEMAGGYICIKNLAKNAKIMEIASTNKNIKAESMLQKYGFAAIHVYPTGSKVKDGTQSKITFKICQNKKIYKLSCKVGIKVESPFTSLQVGKKQYISPVSVQKIPSAKKIVGLYIKEASGYKVTSVEVYGKMSFSEDEFGNPTAISWSKRYEGRQMIKTLQTKDLSGVARIVVNYERVKKPMFYTKPQNWHGYTDSPFSNSKELIFE